MYKYLLLTISIFVFSACGVKGDPLPPLNPIELGYGRPAPKESNEIVDTDKAEKESGKKKEKK